MDDDALPETLAGIAEDVAFGPLQVRSGRLLNQISTAQLMAAENLCSKAARSLSAGDQARAQRLIDRAARMPYDPREQGSPGVMGATLLVYTTISDQFEASEPDDPAWLDVVLAVHPHLDRIGQAEVASVVHGFVLQDALFTVTPGEARRIRRHFAHAPLNTDLDDGPDTTEDQRRAIIGSLATAAAALTDAYTEAPGGR